MVEFYFDTSALIPLYIQRHERSRVVFQLIGNIKPLKVNELQIHEIRNALRLSVFQKSISLEEVQIAQRKFETNLGDLFIIESVDWNEAFNAANNIGKAYTARDGIRGSDLLHLGIAKSQGAREFITFDAKQNKVARKAGFKVKNWADK